MSRKSRISPVSQDEFDQILSDKEWWEERIPHGWKLHGWTDREQASVLTPDNRRLVQIDGDFLAAIFPDRFLGFHIGQMVVINKKQELGEVVSFDRDAKQIIVADPRGKHTAYDRNEIYPTKP